MSEKTTPLELLEAICDELYERWDKDMRSGKLLSALSGTLPNYRADVTAVRAALGKQSVDIISVIDPWTRGAFTGWVGKTSDSKITLEEAEDHFSLCMADMMDAVREALGESKL